MFSFFDFFRVDRSWRRNYSRRLLYWRNASIKGWLGLGLIFGVLVWNGPADVSADACGGGEPQPRSWSQASFQGERLGNRLTADISMVDLPAAVAQVEFLESPRGTAFRPSGNEVVKLSVRIRIDLLGRGPLETENHVWIDSEKGTPFYLVRTRSGFKDYYQQFRFTKEGVFRRQREPATVTQAAGPPATWTKIGEHFYGFPPGEGRCPLIWESSTLIYMISAFGAASAAERGSSCVFHKRQFHRVRFQTESSEAVSFDFLEKKDSLETRRSGTAEACVFRIQSQPIGSYRGQVEDLFGNTALIYVGTDNRLPLMLSGELPLIGRVNLKLAEIRLN
jgi:hypothetical protein